MATLEDYIAYIATFGEFSEGYAGWNGPGKPAAFQQGVALESTLVIMPDVCAELLPKRSPSGTNWFV
jgi:hypothetical protein